jgi:hypothetical protein
VHGVDTIPDADRTSSWLDLLHESEARQRSRRCCSAPCRSRSAPLVWQAVLATVCGVLLGTIFLMPMGLFGGGPARTIAGATASGARPDRSDPSSRSSPRSRSTRSRSGWRRRSRRAVTARHPRLPRYSHPRLRRHRRRACHHRGRLRFPVHAPREQAAVIITI